MSYWRLYYHLAWATKQRLPLIKPELEAKLHGYIIGKADYLGCITHAINGTKNHIHVVASILPSLSISQYVKKIKGSSSHPWNHFLANDYVKNQKIHHSQGTAMSSTSFAIAVLERNSNVPDTS